jgi:flavin reductase (DIM6/NTAB) family NADH-FMN oxidoreductase RutF
MKRRTYRKRDFPLDQIRRFLEPGPIVLVSSAWRGKTNIMTMGWHMMLGFSPALFACYIWEANHSFEMLRRSKECVINLPTTDLVNEVVGVAIARETRSTNLRSSTSRHCRRARSVRR